MRQKEEEEKKKAEDDAKRREEEAKVLKQQQATLAVLRVLQKLSNATPSNFDDLKVEFDKVLQTELLETGTQKEVLKAEAERVLDYAKQHVEQLKIKEKKDAEERAEREKKRGG